MTDLHEKNSQLEESIKENEKKMYNISYEMSALKSNIGVIQQSMTSKCNFDEDISKSTN